MTKLPSVFGNAFKDFDKFFVGFDSQAEQIAKIHDSLTRHAPSYPPYNIKKTGDNTYQIELAVAGFGKQDIEIELNENTLVIRGNTTADETGVDYLFRGIANRTFTRTFALNDNVEIQDAEMLNGMLRVFLERIVPESKKPKIIPVKDAADGKGTSKVLLQETSGR